ncbi:hypothetical protein F4680DRAFT_464550 [Xylaria scruposa]|nr:hypothetical protein F4680DRAFT_464550 [Xylaria scruposa]
MAQASKKATAKAAPPPYEETRSLPPQHQRRPGPAMSGKFYHEDKRRNSMWMNFYPDPSKDIKKQDWAATLKVKCRDIPRLMRKGFFWDDANIIREEGYVDQDPTKSYGKNWSGTRHYFLRDLQQPPRWIATVELFAVNKETLCRFDLNQLSREKMHSARANSQSGHMVYSWEYGFPRMSLNAIYDDRPMEGWWPWPRMD